MTTKQDTPQRRRLLKPDEAAQELHHRRVESSNRRTPLGVLKAAKENPYIRPETYAYEILKFIIEAAENDAEPRDVNPLEPDALFRTLVLDEHISVPLAASIYRAAVVVIGGLR